MASTSPSIPNRSAIKIRIGNTSENQRLDSIVSFLDKQSATLREGHFCSRCCGVLTHWEATFWLYGTESAWNLRLPICLFCEAREKEISMNTGVVKLPNSRVWREAYKAALFAMDSGRQIERIAEAEQALTLRARELVQIGGDHIEEDIAIEDALYALHALRRVAMNRKSPIHHVPDRDESAA